MRSHGKGSLSAATQVKVSSPIIIHIAQGQGFHFLETRISTHVNGGNFHRNVHLAHLLNVEYLRDCYKSLNRNKAVGIDGVWAQSDLIAAGLITSYQRKGKIIPDDIAVIGMDNIKQSTMKYPS